MRAYFWNGQMYTTPKALAADINRSVARFLGDTTLDTIMVKKDGRWVPFKRIVVNHKLKGIKK